MREIMEVNLLQFALLTLLKVLLPSLQFLFQLLPLFLYLLFGLLGIVYFLHAHPDSAFGPGDHAGQRDTGGHRKYGEPSLHAPSRAVTFVIHGSIHPTFVPSVAGSFHWRLSSEYAALISFILCSEYSLTSGSRLATLSGWWVRASFLYAALISSTPAPFDTPRALRAVARRASLSSAFAERRSPSPSVEEERPESFSARRCSW